MSPVQNILENVIRTMLYTNAEALMEKEKGRLIRTFGGSCRHQLMEIASRAKAEGTRMLHLGAQNSTHHVGIAREDFHLLLLDPAMRQMDELSLTHMYDQQRSLESRAYPQGEKSQVKMIVAPTGEKSFGESVQLITGGQIVPLGRTHEFHLSDTKDNPPDVDYDLRTTLEQTTHKLVLIGIGADGRVIKVQMTMNGKVSACLHGEPRSNPLPTTDDLLRGVTEPLDAHPDQLTDYLSEARGILERLLAHGVGKA